RRVPDARDGRGPGERSLSAVRVLRADLPMENHEGGLGQARNARRVDIERLVAELAPRPDVPSSVRKVAVSRTTEAERSLGVQASQAELPAELIATSSAPPSAMRPASTGDSISARDRTWPADVDAVGAGS